MAESKKKTAEAEAPITQAEAEAPIAEDKPEMRKMVRIHLFKDSTRYNAPLFVGVNGQTYLVQRGVDVEVPPEVAEVLAHSQAQDAAARERMEKMQAEAGTKVFEI